MINQESPIVKDFLIQFRLKIFRIKYLYDKDHIINFDETLVQRDSPLNYI